MFSNERFIAGFYLVSFLVLLLFFLGNPIEELPKTGVTSDASVIESAE